MWNSPLEFIASGGGDAKAIRKLHQRCEQGGWVGIRGIEGVVSGEIGGTAEFVESAEVLEIAGERALMSAIGDAGADDFKRGVEEDDGGCVTVEKRAVGRLKEGAASECEDGRTLESRQGDAEMMVLDGAESAFTTGGKQIGNRAVSAGDFNVEVHEGTS